MKPLQSYCLYIFIVGLISGFSSAALAEGHSEGGSTAAQQDASPISAFGLDSFGLDRIELNVYGLSYHPDRETVHRRNLNNQVNPGLALHVVLDDDARGTTFAEAGAYYDSGSNWAKFMGVGYQFKLGDHWRIGGQVALVDSKTYNRGAAFVGMIPLVTYDLGRVKLNAVYFPKVANYNQVDAFGFYLTIPFAAWRR